MAAFMKKLLRFGLYAVICYVFLLVAWAQIPVASLHPNLNYQLGAYGHLHTRLKEVETVHDVDILFLGSSHAYRGFDTRIFAKHGFTAFNLGSSAQTPIQTELLLSRYLDRLKPKLIVYDVFPETFEGDGVESAGDVLSNAKNDLSSLKMALYTNHLKVYNTLVYAVVRDFLGIDSDFKENIHTDVDTYVSGGYVETTWQGPKPEKYDSATWTLNPLQRKTFEGIMTTLRQNGYRVVLVQAPVTKGLFDSYRNNDKIDAYFKTECSDYFNFNQLMSLPDDCFYDSNHLNQHGVELFNKEFLRLLESQKVLAKKP